MGLCGIVEEVAWGFLIQMAENLEKLASPILQY